jgi:hypothetical protein
MTRDIKYELTAYGEVVTSKHTFPIDCYNELATNLMKGYTKTAWMDSIDFEDELGEAPGYHKISHSKKQCIEDHKCLSYLAENPEEMQDCYPLEVVVLRKEFFDKIFKEHIDACSD